jgi:hypothetical protein
MKKCKSLALIYALLFLSIHSDVFSSTSSETWGIRMTLPAKIELERRINAFEEELGNDEPMYISLNVSLGHGLNDNNGIEYYIKTKTLYLGADEDTAKNKANEERIVLFGKEIWISKETKETLENSIIDLIYIFSNDGVVQGNYLLLKEAKPIEKITTGPQNLRSKQIVSEEKISISMPHVSIRFVLGEAIADLYGFQVEFDDFEDINVSLHLNSVTWMEAFDLMLKDTGYNWTIVDQTVHIQKGKIALFTRDFKSSNQRQKSFEQKYNRNPNAETKPLPEFISDVAVKYGINYVLLGSSEAETFVPKIEQSDLYEMFRKLSEQLGYSINLSETNVVMLKKL